MRKRRKGRRWKHQRFSMADAADANFEFWHSPSEEARLPATRELELAAHFLG